MANIFLEKLRKVTFFQGIIETFVGLGMSTGPALGGLLYSVCIPGAIVIIYIF